MKQTRQQRLTELLQESTTNTTATSLVHATITSARSGWAWWFFGGLIGGLLAGSHHDESGFAMIDEGKIYFYSVIGFGKRQSIEGRREIVFSQIERVRRLKGNQRSGGGSLTVRWRNNNNRRVDVSLGGMALRQFPGNQDHINEMTQLILANNIEIKPDKTLRNTILIIIGVFVAALALIGLAYLFIEVL